MKSYYLTDSTTSIEEFSKSFEFLILGSVIKSRKLTDQFISYGDGIISDNFYIGNNLTKYLDEIDIKNSLSCILSMPKVGQYYVSVSNKDDQEFNSKSGGIVLPADKIIYKADSEIIDDLIIIIKMENIKSILEKKYNIISIDENLIKLDTNSDKVSSVRNFIISSLQTAKNFPDIRASLLVKTNIEEIAALLLSDLIADSMGISSVNNNSPDSILVKRAEELIEIQCDRLFSVHEIANKLNTSPRTLQQAFKKHREYTPMQFLKRRKIYRAHKLIIKHKSTNISIKQAALNAGILDLNRFSKYYFDMFGELPSDTIERLNN